MLFYFREPSRTLWHPQIADVKSDFEMKWTWKCDVGDKAENRFYPVGGCALNPLDGYLYCASYAWDNIDDKNSEWWIVRAGEVPHNSKFMDIEYVAQMPTAGVGVGDFFTSGTLEPNGRYWGGSERKYLAYFDDLHKLPGKSFADRSDAKKYMAPEGWDKDGEEEVVHNKFQGHGDGFGRFRMGGHCAEFSGSMEYCKITPYKAPAKFLVMSYGNKLYILDITNIKGGGTPLCHNGESWLPETPHTWVAHHTEFAPTKTLVQMGNEMWMFGSEANAYDTAWGWASSFNMDKMNWEYVQFHSDDVKTERAKTDNPLTNQWKGSFRTDAFNCPGDQTKAPPKVKASPPKASLKWVLLKSQSVCRDLR